MDLIYALVPLIGGWLVYGLIASLFWSALRNGGLFVDYKTEVSREIVVILLSILIFFVSAQKLVSSLERFKFVRKLDAFFTRKIK